MYLLIWSNGRSKQSADELTVLDHLAIKQGLLQVFRVCRDGSRFEFVEHDSKQVMWLPVPQAKTIGDRETQVHL